MAKVKVQKSFRYSPNGYEVITIPEGEQELDDAALKSAKAQGALALEVEAKALAKKSSPKSK